MRRVYFIFLLSAIATTVVCADWTPKAQNLAMPYLWFPAPAHQEIGIIEKGAFEFSPHISYSSHYIGAKENSYGVYQVMELATFYFRARYGASERVSVDIEAPFHTLFKNSLRGKFHSGQDGANRWFALKHNGEFIFNGGDERTALGDASAGISIKLKDLQAEKGRIVSRVAIEIPTGDDDKGFGNGRFDAIASVGADWKIFNGAMLYARLHGVRPGNYAPAPDIVTTRFYWGVNGGAVFPVTEKIKAGGTFFWNTSPIADKAIPIISRNSAGVGAGVLFEATDKTSVEVAFSEDLTDGARATQDFSIIIGVRRTIKGR